MLFVPAELMDEYPCCFEIDRSEDEDVYIGADIFPFGAKDI